MQMPVLHGERLTLRPLAEEDLEPLAAILATPSVAPWWGPGESTQEAYDGLRNDGAAFAIEVGGALAGWLGVCEEAEPSYRHTGLDIVLAAEHQDRGLGTEALRLAIRWLIAERGHHRFTIDPAIANARAIRAYAAVGFRPVGVMRDYEQGRDGVWHDNLLMDLLADELREPDGAREPDGERERRAATDGPQVVWMPGGVRTELLLGGEDSGGAFCLLVDEPPAGWSLPPHRHRDAAETIHVLEGEFELEVAGTRARLRAGQSIHVPRGVVHAGANVGAGTGRRVVLFSPAGMERFFREAGAASPDADADLGAALAAALRHGWEFVAPG